MIFAFKSITLFFLIAFFSLFFEVTHAQASGINHHSFFDHEWKVEHSRERGGIVNCTDPKCLEIDYSISFGDHPNVQIGESLLFKINDPNGQPSYRFSVTAKHVERIPCRNSKQCMFYFVGHFFDTAPTKEEERVPDNPPRKTICVSAVRYQDAFFDTALECRNQLRSLAEQILNESEIISTCGNEDNLNLVYWDIVDGHIDHCAQKGFTALGDPESGQGTASGKPPGP